MYESFYGLSCKPFQLNPDPAFYFNSKQHRRAQAYLEYGVSRNEGFIVVTGEIGTGKTTMIAGLLRTLNDTNVHVGQLVTTQLDAEDTLRMVGAAFGFNVTGVSKSQLLITLEAFLISQASKGMRCLLIVDEAQNLTPRAVEELRMLSNYQLGTQALLQTFLVGQPEFKRILWRPEMEQLRQRVAAACHIGPMDLEDTQRYIEHRLKCAGATDKPVFEAGTFEAIHQASQGIPRRINGLCDRLLLFGFINQRFNFGPGDVKEVAAELADEVGGLASAPMPLGGNFQPSTPAELDGPRAAVDANGSGGRHAGNGGLAEFQQSMERKFRRLERINLETLTAVQALVAATKKPPEA
jgi:general secretion pathway protein A